MDFNKRYAKLNPAQKQAVDIIDGPVMVIAGPGTGKTELISVRAANILQKTDTLPENILCLTFTDSGANAMRERLVSIIGKDAYKVAIHTFHSFGTEVINQFGEFFYQGAHFRPADELSRYQIIRTIFDGLGLGNSLNIKMNGDYTHLSDSLTVISELKKSGLTSDELLEILDANDAVIQKTEQLLVPIFSQRISKSTAGLLSDQIDAVRASAGPMILPSIVPLSVVLAESLSDAVESADETDSTKPITAWRNHWFKKDETGQYMLKSRDRQIKLRAVSSVYEQYLARMEEAELYDFDDMILRVVHGMEVFDELRFNLQEKYQYIMVDEFQDTNMAQMRIIQNLTNNIVQGDTPNILVVGDDDQAIYSFQGADISNIIDFQANYPKAQIIALTDNYRSGNVILASARDIITQGSERLEDRIAELDKNLRSLTKNGPGVTNLLEAETSADERHWVVEQINNSIANGQKPSDIAVITRKHLEIEKLLPYFVRADIAVQYERRDNVLDQAPIVIVEQLARMLIGLYLGQYKEVNAQLPQVLSHPAWGIDPMSIWKLSLAAYESHSHWLDAMASVPEFIPLQQWFVTTALSIPHQPLENILDVIVGKLDGQVGETEHDDETEATASADGPDSFRSPLYDYFFSETSLAANPEAYIRFLESLRTIRTKLRDYNPTETPNLETFIEFINLHHSIGSGITSVRSASQKDNAVQLMTAHKSKGLEFDSVYILNAIDSVWGERARSRSRLIGYPENLPIAPVGNNGDERLRLFYVAMTRAKNELNISYSLADDSNKTTARASFLVDTSLQPTVISSAHNLTDALQTAEIRWYESSTHPSGDTLKDLLAPQLEHYQLSVTHMANFLDVSRGGPQNFLLQNLLRFPQAMSPAAAYGSAVHKTLQRAHAHLSAHGQRQAIEDILHNFETTLQEQHLSRIDYEKYFQKGSDDLQAFLTESYETFTPLQKTELNFKSQHSIVGQAHLSGALDLVDIGDDKTVTVTDYKTGKPARNWVGKTDYEKIKLHKYKQQLMFYKLLVESARDYRGYKVDSGVLQFVEPTRSGDIVSLRAEFDPAEQDQFVRLINAVWRHVVNLELPDVSNYSPTLKGILAFEQDLIDETV